MRILMLMLLCMSLSLGATDTAKITKEDYRKARKTSLYGLVLSAMIYSVVEKPRMKFVAAVGIGLFSGGIIMFRKSREPQ